ncbi:MAG: hypothetical protein M0001_13145 [Treponema sp.]|nr:hypothetical protein [Treponema sp.]
MSDSPRPLEFVTFRREGADFAIEARWVRSLRPAAEPAPPAAGLAAPAATPAAPTATPLRLALAIEPGAIEVERPVELVAIAPENLHPLPPALTARCAIRGLKALSIGGGGLLILLDPKQL